MHNSSSKIKQKKFCRIFITLCPAKSYHSRLWILWLISRTMTGQTDSIVDVKQWEKTTLMCLITYHDRVKIYTVATESSWFSVQQLL